MLKSPLRRHNAGEFEGMPTHYELVQLSRRCGKLTMMGSRSVISVLTALRAETGLAFALEAPFEAAVELSRLLSGFLTAVACFVVAGKDDVCGAGLRTVLVVLTVAEDCETMDAALPRAEARVTFPVVVFAIEERRDNGRS